MNIAHMALNMLYPPVCVACGQQVAGDGLCSACWVKVDFILAPVCALCGNPCAHTCRGVCRLCLDNTPILNSHVSIMRYGVLARKLVFALKYGRQRYLARLFAHWMVPKALMHCVDCIVPVPLHAKKLAKRGFNQALLIASFLSRLTGIPVNKGIIVRHLNTPSQGRFSAHQRHDNVFGAFSSTHSNAAGLRVLLVDDVYTTGATLDACAVALKEGGVLHVHAVTVAKVII